MNRPTHPQTVPALNQKTNSPRSSRQTPPAPAPYQPQAVPHCLQRKTAQHAATKVLQQKPAMARNPAVHQWKAAQLNGARGGLIQRMVAPPPAPNAHQTFTFVWKNEDLAQLLNSQGGVVCEFSASVGGNYRESAMYTNWYQCNDQGKGYSSLLMYLVAKIAKQRGLEYIEIKDVTYDVTIDSASTKWGFGVDPKGKGGDRWATTNTVLSNTTGSVTRRGFGVPSVVTGKGDIITIP